MHKGGMSLVSEQISPHAAVFVLTIRGLTGVGDLHRRHGDEKIQDRPQAAAIFIRVTFRMIVTAKPDSISVSIPNSDKIFVPDSWVRIETRKIPEDVLYTPPDWIPSLKELAKSISDYTFRAALSGSRCFLTQSVPISSTRILARHGRKQDKQIKNTAAIQLGQLGKLRTMKD
jgi:hypothetical protein